MENYHNPRTISDFARPSLDYIRSSIEKPIIAANCFEINPEVIQLIHNMVQFDGLPNEDPKEHLASFLDICDTFKINGVTDDAVKLLLFRFSLRDQAKIWLRSLPPTSITTWNDLAEKFLVKYFPPSKTVKFRNHNNLRTISDFARPSLDYIRSSIVKPTVAADCFQINPDVIQMVYDMVQFDGLPDKDPNAHIANFLEICDTFKINGVTDDAIRLRLFPFSLRDRAKMWLRSLPRGSITTWNILGKKFLTKYFPPSKTAKLRNDIYSFIQMDGESLYDTWERYKDLLIRCPHHGLPTWLQIEIFCNGLSALTRQMIDAAARNNLTSKMSEVTYELIEELAINDYEWDSSRNQQVKEEGVHQIDMLTALTAQVEALNQKLDMMLVNSVKLSCELCGGAHASEDCEHYNMYASHEHLAYTGNQDIPQNNLYDNTYNPSWKNHPGFSWRSSASNQPPAGFPARPSHLLQNQYQHPSQNMMPLVERKPSLEDLMTPFPTAFKTQF